MKNCLMEFRRAVQPQTTSCLSHIFHTWHCITLLTLSQRKWWLPKTETWDRLMLFRTCSQCIIYWILMFPSLKAIIQVVLTIPVSSCSSERSFSVLCWLHPWLRRTMGQSRLQHLAAMSIEKEVLESQNTKKWLVNLPPSRWGDTLFMERQRVANRDFQA